jgi:ABC-type nitrate/sulfonate/bicarbonate transport system substrate-binding protein
VRAIIFADRVRPMTLNMGSVPTLAADLGFMAHEGLDVEVVQRDGSPKALAALEAGEAEMAQVNIAPVVEEVSRGAPLKIVWGNVHGDPLRPAPPPSAEVGVAVVSSPSMSRIDQLKGARIGISGKGATNHLAVVSLLKAHGIDPERGVRWVEGGTPVERVEKVISGEIDAAWTTSQTLALFEAKGRFKILASGRDFANTEAVAFLVVVAKEELVSKEPQTVLAAVRGLIRASREFNENRDRWVAGAAKRRPEVGRDAIVKCWEQTRGHWPVNGRLDPGVAEGAAARLKRAGQVSAVPPASKGWVDMSFVDKALTELGKRKE